MIIFSGLNFVDNGRLSTELCPQIIRRTSAVQHMAALHRVLYIAVHLLIADIQIDKIFAEYTQEHFEASTSYFRKHMN